MNNNTKKIPMQYLSMYAVHVTLYFHFFKLTLWKLFILLEYVRICIKHGCSKVWNIKSLET